MSNRPPWAGSAAPAQGLSTPLSRRISRQLVRILRTYVVLLTGLLMLIMLGGGWVYFRTEIRHQRDLVLTKVSTELDNAGDELRSLASAPILWTGLTDSFGRETYLEPLLARFNSGANRSLLLLDYRGRLFMAPTPSRAAPSASGAPDLQGAEAANLALVKAAVAEGRNSFGTVLGADGITRMVLVERVMSPMAQSPVGFLVAVLDADAFIRELSIDPEVRVAFALGSETLAPPMDSFWHMTIVGRRQVDFGQVQAPLQVWLGQQLNGAIALMLATLAVTLALGWWTIRRVVTWSRRFAAGTTRRYEQLLVDCQRLLAGEPVNSVAPLPAGQHDELSDVTDALTAMLQRQKEATDELRKTSLVFSTSAEGILVTDAEGRIVDVNPALSAMTGYAHDELVGRQAGALYRSVGSDDTSRVMTQALERDGRWSGETSFLARNGRVIPTTVSISRIRDESGANQGTVTVITDVSRLKEAENTLRDLAYRDGLTGLPNFRRMSEDARTLFQRAGGTGHGFAVLFFDMDRLKFVNDSYGHEAGDVVIKALAAHLRASLPRGHLLCRRSGDEFIAIVDLPGGESRAYLQRILDQLNPLEVSLPNGGRLPISATVGVSRFPEDGHDWQTLMIRADIAMNEAKQRQRGSVGWFDAAMGQRQYRQRLLQTRLAQAIQDCAVEIHYQPEVDLRTGAVVGFEALARWADPELGVVRPSEFVAMAEEAHLIDALSQHVVQVVMRDKASLQARFPGARVAVNVSPSAFLGGRLLKFLGDQLDAGEAALEGLEVELTESHIASNEGVLLAQLQTLTGMGVRVAIDDFGTGYSSLSRLTQFPISRLKIDRSFVAGLELGRQSKIARLIINLARVLGFEVTAEGVETLSQQEMLLEMGCTRAQGWLFARALPLQQALALPAVLEPVPPAED